MVGNRPRPPGLRNDVRRLALHQAAVGSAHGAQAGAGTVHLHHLQAGRQQQQQRQRRLCTLQCGGGRLAGWLDG